jgi:hypothetical protein
MSIRTATKRTADETGLLTLGEALTGKRIVRVVATKTTRPCTLPKLAGERLAERLMQLAGEWYEPGVWAASHQTCKEIGYRTVMVSVESETEALPLEDCFDEHDEEPHEKRAVAMAKDFRICTLHEALSQPGMMYGWMRTSKHFCVSPKTARKTDTILAEKLKIKLMHLPGRLNAAGTEWKALAESSKSIGFTLIVINLVPDPNPVPVVQPAATSTKPKPSMVESVIWIDIAKETPDEGVVVLLFHPDSSEPVWPGVFEGCTADGYAFSHADGSMINGPVLAWAELPGGPRI